MSETGRAHQSHWKAGHKKEGKRFHAEAEARAKGVGVGEGGRGTKRKGKKNGCRAV